MNIDIAGNAKRTLMASSSVLAKEDLSKIQF